LAKQECPSCGVEIEKGHEVCPICGYEFPAGKSTVKWVAIIMVILFAWPLIKLLLRLLGR